MEFIIEHSSFGSLTYNSAFDLRIVDFTVSYPENDNVIEPGEKATISSVTLRNVGGMPTPPTRDIMLSI